MSTDQPLALIADGQEYSLQSTDDGAIFVLSYKTDGIVANIQGDDATRFKADYDTIKQQFPAWPPDQLLAQLWDQGGYSWLATQEG